jgi:SAM-dependent methyltransferase
MPTPDSKQSEKDYLRRSSAGEWELHKPFSPPGSDTLEDSANLIQDFAVALQTLRPVASDLILDLGAGSCWCSDWLERLNLRTVAVDISLDMLRVGQARLPRGHRSRQVAGDMEHLPFAAGAFDKAVCLSALHHVPDLPSAVQEVSRVLKPDGVALFSEPGVGHSTKPGSVVAMRDFGVLEQDIVIGTFMDLCLRSGFADVRLKPISYVIPEFDLTLDQWNQWQRFWRRKRPLRAAQKMWRAFVEFFGAGKGTLLLEEVFAVNLIRLLKQPVEHHPVLVAYKSPVSVRIPAVLGADVEIIDAPRSVRAGAPMDMSVRIRNRGNQPWRANSSEGDFPRVRVGVQLVDGQRKLVNRDFHRADLPKDLSPGDEAVVRLVFTAPGTAGPHGMKVDLVIEGVTWFEPKGSTTAVWEVEVRP